MLREEELTTNKKSLKTKRKHGDTMIVDVKNTPVGLYGHAICIKLSQSLGGIYRHNCLRN